MTVNQGRGLASIPVSCLLVSQASQWTWVQTGDTLGVRVVTARVRGHGGVRGSPLRWASFRSRRDTEHGFKPGLWVAELLRARGRSKPGLESAFTPGIFTEGSFGFYNPYARLLRPPALLRPPGPSLSLQHRCISRTSFVSELML